MHLDTHQHFWRYHAEAYPWIPVGSPLQRDWLPADLAPLQIPLGLQGSIAVQARQSLEETHWLLGMADADPRVMGVVGWVDLQADDVEKQLERLARHPRLVGVRHVVQDEPDDAFLLRPAFQRGLSCLRAFDLTYDLLIYPRQLPAAIETVRRLPDQPFVLDHLAKPFIRDGTLSPWREQIQELARLPNVCCKVSGMVTEAHPTTWQPADLRPYLDTVGDAFGPSRLLFGTDWPVCLLAASYARVFEVARTWTTDHARFNAAEQAAFLGGNGARFYGLTEAAPE